MEIVNGKGSICEHWMTEQSATIRPRFERQLIRAFQSARCTCNKYILLLLFVVACSNRSDHCLSIISFLFLSVSLFGHVVRASNEMIWSIRTSWTTIIPFLPHWFNSSLSQLFFFFFSFFKGPIVESFCSGNATIVGASLETKTRPSHLSSEMRERERGMKLSRDETS